MKLIIQKLDGVLYAYTESKSHFNAVEGSRGTPRLDPALLGNRCELDAYGEFHMVFDVKKPKGKGKK